MASIEEIKLSDDEQFVTLIIDDGKRIKMSTYDWYGIPFGHKTGPVEDSLYSQLLRLEECSKAKQKLLSLLSYSGNSRKGFGDKLKRYGFSEESIEYALDFAEEQKLIDDKEYAEALAYELVEVKLYGPMRVRQEMFRHGVEKEIGDNAIQKYFQRDPDGLCTFDRNMHKSAVAKARGLDLTDPKQREKLFAALNRAGYEFSRIAKLRFNKK